MNMPFDSDYIHDPYRAMGRLREDGPVHQVTTPDGSTLWLVTRYQEARDAFADPRLSLDKRNSSGGYAGFGLPGALDRNLLNMDPPDHTRIRRLVGQAFTARRVERLGPAVQRTADELLDQLDDHGARADLMAGYAFPLPVTLICDLLGVPAESRPDFRRWTDSLVAPEAGADPRKAMGEMLAYLMALLGAKRADPGDDLISALIRAHDGDDRLDENELVSLVFLLLWAGYETTVDLIGNGLRLILSDPEARDALLSGRQAAADVIEEVLRCDSPAILGIRRFATEDLEVGGQVIPAGDTVMVSVAAANHDPALFKSPESFMPGFRDHSHLSFGYGIHHCLGAPLARLEGRIAVSAALRRYPAMQLGVPSAGLEWRPSIRSHGLRSLPVLLKP